MGFCWCTCCCVEGCNGGGDADLLCTCDFDGSWRLCCLSCCCCSISSSTALLSLACRSCSSTCSCFTAGRWATASCLPSLPSFFSSPCSCCCCCCCCCSAGFVAFSTPLSPSYPLLAAPSLPICSRPMSCCSSPADASLSSLLSSSFCLSSLFSTLFLTLAPAPSSLSGGSSFTASFPPLVGAFPVPAAAEAPAFDPPEVPPASLSLSCAPLSRFRQRRYF